MILRLLNTHIRRNTIATLTRRQQQQQQQPARRIIAVATQQQFASFHHTPLRAASMPEGWNASDAHPIVQKIRDNPQVMDQLVEFTVLLQKKGIDVAGKQPGFADVNMYNFFSP